MAIDTQKITDVGGIMVQDNTIKLNRDSILKLLAVAGIIVPTDAKIYLPLVIGMNPPLQRDVNVAIDSTASLVVEWTETTGVK